MRPTIHGLSATVMAASLALISTFALSLGTANAASGLLHDTRHDASDLEIGDVISPGKIAAARYIAYEDLLKLPQVAYTVSDDSNFAPHTQISGVALDQLVRLLGPRAGRGASSAADLIVALCNDRYRANYPREYVAAHHPLLVLKVNGKPPGEWPKSHDGGPMGPYMISNPTFTPSFRILSHKDEPQIPYGVVRLEFRSQAEVFGAIRPPGSYPAGSPVVQGYKIAQQNCYRCHNMGREGGQMAGHPWPVLAAWAASGPKYFATYVRNPRAVGGDRKMPAMTDYDDRTIEALRQYFATFAAFSRSAARSR